MLNFVRDELIIPANFKDNIVSTSENIFYQIYMFIRSQIVPFVASYSFVFIGLLTVIIIFLIIKWAKNNMPSKGRITDIYDSTGAKYDPKKKKKNKNKYENLKDLPEEFYKRK
jgi:hypothetical protein